MFKKCSLETFIRITEIKRSDNMKCGRILRWLLGIWLVETVAARHILNGEDTGNSQQSHRLGRGKKKR